jgi:phage terminase large subunit-like protein
MDESPPYAKGKARPRIARDPRRAIEGDAVLTAHVLNAAAHVDPSGHWKVRKIKQSHKIDGLVASVIAYSCAARAPAKRTIAFAWA